MKFALILTLSCIGAAVASTIVTSNQVFPGIKDLEQHRRDLQDSPLVSDECAEAIAGNANTGQLPVEILDQVSEVSGGNDSPDPQMITIRMFLSQDLSICTQGVWQWVHFLARDNGHAYPDENVDFLEVPETADLIPVSAWENEAEGYYLNGVQEAKAVWWGYQTGDSDGVNEDVKYAFIYQLNTPKVEQLILDGFISEGEELRTRAYTYTEQTLFLMHTLWLEDNFRQLSRWFEWNVIIRTYMTLKPMYTEPATVYPVEIKVPPCGKTGSCVMTVQHSGQIIFIEERANGPVVLDDTVTPPEYSTGTDGYPNNVVYLTDDQIDWTKERVGLQFASLAQNVLFAITLKDRTSSRKFILANLQYNYDSRPPSIYLFNSDPENKVEKDQVVNIGWNDEIKGLTFQLRFLKLGRVRGLTFKAIIKLCKLDEGVTFGENECNELPLSEATAEDAGEDILPVDGERRLLSERYLADADKTVVQQYSTEEIGACSDCLVEEQKYLNNGGTTDIGTGTGGEGSMAIVIVLLVLILVGGAAFGVWYMMNNKKGNAGQAYEAGNQA